MKLHRYLAVILLVTAIFSSGALGGEVVPVDVEYQDSRDPDLFAACIDHTGIGEFSSGALFRIDSSYTIDSSEAG